MTTFSAFFTSHSTSSTVAAGLVEAPTRSADGRSLYVHSKDGNRFVIYRAAR